MDIPVVVVPRPTRLHDPSCCRAIPAEQNSLCHAMHLTGAAQLERATAPVPDPEIVNVHEYAGGELPCAHRVRLAAEVEVHVVVVPHSA